MYAIIETGGKQYRVQNGDQLKVEKLSAKDGEAVVFDKVLVAGEGADIKVGTPYLEGFTVEGEVVESGKGQKVIIFKYKSKKDYRKKQGHRQPYTMVEIKAIGGVKAEKKAAPKKEEKKPEAPKAKVEAKAKAEAPKAESSEQKPLSKMLKAELIDYAKANGIEIDAKATKAVIIEAIEAAK